MAAMNTHATAYATKVPTTGTPSPPLMPGALPLAIVALATIVLLLIGAPAS